MDPAADISALLDSLTSQTSAERFGQILADPAYCFPPAASPPVSPSFDVPLVSPQQPNPDPLTADLLSSSPIPLVSVLPRFADYSLPLSAVTAASSHSDSHSAPPSPQLPIRKKRARSRSANHTADKFLALHPRPTTSDVSSASFPNPRSKPEPLLETTTPTTTPTPPPRPNPPFPSAPPSAPLTPTHTPTHTPVSFQSPQPKSHTRKCREKVTKQFENLLEVLPRPPNGVEVKHKAQILELAINTFRDLLLKRTLLQAEIALASKQALRQWMDMTIASASTSLPRDLRGNVPLSAVLEPFVGLYCVKKGWTYGELWLVDNTSKASLASCVFNTDDEHILASYSTFATMSRSRYATAAHLSSGIVQRVIASKRPEWLDDLASDPSTFERAALATEHGLCVAHAVPVILPENRCAGVLLFADVTSCTFSTADMTALLGYTNSLGAMYMEYTAQAEKRIFNQRPQEPKLEAKPIRSAEPAMVSPDRTSVSNIQPQYACNSLDMQSGMPGPGLLPHSSETSAAFSREAEFLARA